MEEPERENGALEQLAVGVEDDDGDVGRTEHAELVRLLEQAILALEERDLAVAVVLDGRDRDLAATHLVCEGGRGRGEAGSASAGEGTVCLQSASPSSESERRCRGKERRGEKGARGARPALGLLPRLAAMRATDAPVPHRNRESSCACAVRAGVRVAREPGGAPHLDREGFVLVRSGAGRLSEQLLAVGAAGSFEEAGDCSSAGDASPEMDRGGEGGGRSDAAARVEPGGTTPGETRPRRAAR